MTCCDRRMDVRADLGEWVATTIVLPPGLKAKLNLCDTGVEATLVLKEWEQERGQGEVEPSLKAAVSTVARQVERWDSAEYEARRAVARRRHECCKKVGVG